MKILTPRALLLAPILLAWLAAGHAFALEDTTAASKDVKATKTAPVVRTVKFEADQPVSFKQRLIIYNRAKADSDKLHCREDRMTGSHRKKMRCVTMATKELEEDAARAFFRALR